ncbi:MAG: hypothetical protein PWP08_1829 [Methanofollis sp.]|nr:hypothetical protein [Methanofollis sp.]
MGGVTHVPRHHARTVRRDPDIPGRRPETGVQDRRPRRLSSQPPLPLDPHRHPYRRPLALPEGRPDSRPDRSRPARRQVPRRRSRDGDGRLPGRSCRKDRRGRTDPSEDLVLRQGRVRPGVSLSDRGHRRPPRRRRGRLRRHRLPLHRSLRRGRDRPPHPSRRGDRGHRTPRPLGCFRRRILYGGASTPFERTGRVAGTGDPLRPPVSMR